MTMILDAFRDSLVDTIKLVPFLFLTYLAMEILERRAGDHSSLLLTKVGPFSPLVGALVGVIPQCGFSAAAASLYSGGLISLGALLAVFLSTSDEMIPIFISEQVPLSQLLRIILAKALLGAVSGLAVDLFIRLRHLATGEKHIRDLCEREHAGLEEEEGSAVRAALIHTAHITLFVFLISLILSFLVEGVGQATLHDLLSEHASAGVLVCTLIGLIPNCAASVLLTQFYLEGILSAGQMMSGLLVGAGVGLLVLFRTNRHLKENLSITFLLWCVGVFWGIILEHTGLLGL